MKDDFTMLEIAAWGGLLGNHSRMMRRIDANLQEHSRITHPEFEALLRLSWATNHRLRIQDLAAKSMLSRSGISRVVERLERVGLVKREGASEDRRGAYAVLTPAGLTRFEAALKAHVALVRQHFLEVFSESELEQMATFWKRIENHNAKFESNTKR